MAYDAEYSATPSNCNGKYASGADAEPARHNTPSKKRVTGSSEPPPPPPPPLRRGVGVGVGVGARWRGVTGVGPGSHRRRAGACRRRWPARSWPRCSGRPATSAESVRPWSSVTVTRTRDRSRARGNDGGGRGVRADDGRRIDGGRRPPSTRSSRPSGRRRRRWPTRSTKRSVRARRSPAAPRPRSAARRRRRNRPHSPCRRRRCRRAKTLRELEILIVYRHMAGLDGRIVGNRSGEGTRAFAQPGQHLRRWRGSRSGTASTPRFPRRSAPRNSCPGCCWSGR